MLAASLQFCKRHSMTFTVAAVDSEKDFDHTRLLVRKDGRKAENLNKSWQPSQNLIRRSPQSARL